MSEQDAVPAEPDAVTFADLNLDPRVHRAISDVGYETPSPIQAEAIPPLLDGHHVVGLAQTGTGKTAAFALPILSRLDLKQTLPQALVLAPTRELALQVSEAFERYAAHLPNLRVLPVYGGQAYGVQLSALRRGVHVVVGTPGRIMDHLDKGTLDLSELKFVVLDEADEMLNMGFAEDVEQILSTTPDDKQVALFSATMPRQIRRMTQLHAPGAVEISVKSKTATASNVTQRYVKVAHHQKLDALTRILEVENFDGMIIFVRTKQATEELAERLRARGFSAAAINGDVVQQQRERTIDQLRKGSLDILVATDVAARGLDVERISHVINHDIPTDTESYVHRIGRTGRAGRSGNAISFVTPRETHLLRTLEKANRTALEPMAIPSVDDVNATRVERFTDAITAALGDPQVALFRDLIAAYEVEHDVPVADIAAAIAVLAQDGEALLLDPDPAPTQRPEKERRGPREDMVRWRINVGRKHGVEPRQIVGALANEGGLRRGDFGRIEIKSTFSLVELPELSDDTLARLANTQIGGELIDIRMDRGRPRGGGRDSGGPRDRYQKPRPQGSGASRDRAQGRPRRDDGPQAKKPRQKKRP